MCYRLSLFLTLVISVFPSKLPAGSPILSVSQCLDSQANAVEVRFRGGLRGFAVVRKEKESPSPDESPYVIYVNPDLYYLSRDTQEWLYQRQCAHIKQNHEVIHKRSSRLNIDDEREADCIAVHLMLSDSERNLSSREFYSIERDIERVVRENRWSDVLPGPERRISLQSCLGK
jgi:hypothetical protein